MAGEEAVLATTVHVDGQVFHAGDSVPTDVAAQITNPKAWAGGVAPEGEDGGESSLQIPPRGGAGSGADAWRAYAAAASEAKGLQIEIPADATRDDIIEALKGADIPVE